MPSSTGAEGDRPPFDRGAAAHALSRPNLDNCGFAGSVRIEVTFDPETGRVIASKLLEPVKLLGTSVASCMLARVGNVSVPRVSGAPVHVKRAYAVR